MRRLSEWIARGTGWLSRRLGRGGGTTIPGLILLKLRPRAGAELSDQLASGSVLISATNGKTTTARLVRSATDAAEIRTVANPAGSNLLRGVVTALLESDGRATMGVFEVDEAALPAVADQLNPHTIVLMNLFRDQLDRYGELESLVRLWRDVIADLDDDTRLVLNADDPAIAYLGHDRPSTVFFGIDDPSVGRSEQVHAADSTHCPRCDHELAYSLMGIGHLGHWSCPNCSLSRPTPHYAARRVSLRGTNGFDIEITGPDGVTEAEVLLPGLHNAYNVTAAVAVSSTIGVPAALLPAALEGTAPAFGRGERVSIDGREIILLLAKNPTGVNENIQTILADGAEPHVLIVLNDRTADGQDVSWIWDVDYERLFARAASVTVSGDRAYELALRFQYGGFPLEQVVVEPAVPAAVDAAIAAAPAGAQVFVLPTYTSMLEIREYLVRRGAADPFWEES